MMNMDFVKKYIEKLSPSFVIATYVNGDYNEYVFGDKEVLPNRVKASNDTLYDVSSITKNFTATMVYIAYEENRLKLDDYVYNLDNRFVNLKNVTVLDLLSHNQEVYTDGFLGAATSYDDFYRILFSSYVKSNDKKYVDAHYIILSTILEKLYNCKFDKLIEEKIFKKLNMNDATFSPLKNRCASCNYDLVDGKRITDIEVGTVHDRKARTAKKFGITTGHASLFITASDLTKFLLSFLDCSLLKKETIDIMKLHDDINSYNLEFFKRELEVQDGSLVELHRMFEEKFPDYMVFKTYNNMSARYRNKIPTDNEIPDFCPDNSMGFSGFTGPRYLIDFDNKIIIVVLQNPIHNTNLTSRERKLLGIELLKNIYDNLRS